MEKKFTAEEVAQIIMNDAEENEDNEGESSVTSDSFQSTSDDESVQKNHRVSRKLKLKKMVTFHRLHLFLQGYRRMFLCQLVKVKDHG